MKYSIVMPVFKRSEILEKSLKSIQNQLLQPMEVILIDNNVINIETEKLHNIVEEFKINSKIDIKLLKSTKNSGAIARNMGAKVSRGDIVAFLDSDVVLDNDYYLILMEYFYNNQDLIAIQGADRSLIESQSKVKNYSLPAKILYSFEQFFETSLLFNKKSAYVSPSMAVSHPNVLIDFEVQSQWISTCAGLFKRDLFDRYEFPKQFITYSNNEYLMFSYNLFLNNEGLMLYTNKAKYRDLQTNSGRISIKALIYQIQTYDLFIFLKLFKKSPRNILIYIRSRLGILIYNLVRLFFYRSYSFVNYFDVIYSIIYPIKNIRLILKGNLSFYENDFYREF